MIDNKDVNKMLDILHKTICCGRYYCSNCLFDIDADDCKLLMAERLGGLYVLRLYDEVFGNRYESGDDDGR